MKTWGIWTGIFGMNIEVAEFKNKEDAEKAKEYLEKKYGGRYRVLQEKVYESYDEFLKDSNEKERVEDIVEMEDMSEKLKKISDNYMKYVEEFYEEHDLSDIGDVDPYHWPDEGGEEDGS